MTTYIPSWIYQQFDADYTLDHPAEGYGGWKKIDAPFDLDKCAVVLMHAWELQSFEEIPGHWRCVDYIPRAEAICKDLLPPFLAKVRKSGILLIHVGDAAQDISHYPGYKAAKALAGENTVNYPRISRGEAVEELAALKHKYGHPGEHNAADIEKGRKMGFDFNKHVRPINDEYVATNSEQLYRICEKHGVDHLIYTGFAINFCLMTSPGGWVDMTRRGVTCSAVKELVTAVENRESIGNELHKEYGLWNLSLNSGVVLEEKDLSKALCACLGKKNG